MTTTQPGVTATRRIVSLLAIAGLWQSFVLHEAMAGQPLDKVVTALNHSSTSAAPGRTAGMQLPGGRLDLRPPSAALAGDVEAGANAPESYPDAMRRMLFSSANASRFEPGASTTADAWRLRPAPGAGTATPGTTGATPASTHIMSPMETLTHNFREEGLPVARLFESKDSLVHVGLNQKGKPGLWILHKLH
jgi:hypothetical protein